MHLRNTTDTVWREGTVGGDAVGAGNLKSAKCKVKGGHESVTDGLR